MLELGESENRTHSCEAEEEGRQLLLARFLSSRERSDALVEVEPADLGADGERAATANRGREQGQSLGPEARRRRGERDAHRVHLEGRAGDLGAVGDDGAGHDGLHEGAALVAHAQALEAAADRVDEAQARGRVGNVRLDLQEGFRESVRSLQELGEAREEGGARSAGNGRLAEGRGEGARAERARETGRTS